MAQVRNTIGAHRDLSNTNIQAAVERLGEDWMVKTTNDLFDLVAKYGTTVGGAVILLEEHLRQTGTLKEL